MKETFNKSVKLADGLVKMHFTVKMTATALSAPDATATKFTENRNAPSLVGMKRIGTSDSFSSSTSAQTTIIQQAEACTPKNDAAQQSEQQIVSPAPPKAPRLR